MTSFNNIDEIKQAWLDGVLVDGPLAGKNEDDDNVIIASNNEGFYIITSQKNGWLRTDEFLYDSEQDIWIYSESYSR